MNDFWNGEVSLQQNLEKVRELMQSTIAQSHSFIRVLLEQQLHTSGKMLRPALVIIGGGLGNPERHAEVLRIASVIEMIHLASLVHDDIIDEAQTRRGKTTLYAQSGAKQAVLAGDYLLSRAMSLVGGKEGDLESSAVSNAFSRLCESELEQDAQQGTFLISEHTYLRRIAGKTAALFALSAYAGAAVAEATKSHQRLMHQIGYNLGMGFQIQDDILDYVGKSHILGKDIGKDLLCGIPTLPLIAALSQTENKKEDVEKLKHLVSKPSGITKRDIGKIIELTISLGGVEIAQKRGKAYHNRGKEAIERLDNPAISATLMTLYDRLSCREA